jgi:hypothetical protein
MIEQYIINYFSSEANKIKININLLKKIISQLKNNKSK